MMKRIQNVRRLFLYLISVLFKLSAWNESKSAQNIAFDQIPFCIWEIILKGMYKVCILIWQIIMNTLKKNTTTNKNKGPTPSWEENIFAIQSLFIGKEFFP